MQLFMCCPMCFAVRVQGASPRWGCSRLQCSTARPWEDARMRGALVQLSPAACALALWLAVNPPALNGQAVGRPARSLPSPLIR